MTSNANGVASFWKSTVMKWWMGIYVGLAIRWWGLSKQRGVAYNTVAEAETEAFAEWLAYRAVDVAQTLPPWAAVGIPGAILVAVAYPKIRRLMLMGEASIREHGLLKTAVMAAMVIAVAALYWQVRMDPPAELEPFVKEPPTLRAGSE